MDRRSWPWKKKSEKAAAAADSVNASLSRSGSNQVEQDNNKNANYVQISVESYTHLTELEDQVKDLQEKLTSANEKLSAAHSEITAKDLLVKQHTKVAEEAVSGWEKAEAEAAALKHQLESVTLLKLTVEERACHLDGALKECMKQVRNVKEEGEQNLQNIVFAKSRQWEKVKFELEARIVDFEQELLRASAENAAISRSLQEYSNALMKVSEEKSQADAQIEVLKNNIQSYEREVNSYKYELQIVAKELEIRSEEKDMSIRSAEVANKQHSEDVKKLAKLEAECQRLRGLVRKKLPGPAALAQMKIEVENLGRDYGETKLRRSPARCSTPHHPPVPDFALENIQHLHKENEFLTARLLAVEEETNMLKEALTKRNSELQTSRNICAKTVNKLRSLEAQVVAFNHQKSPGKPNVDIHFENESNPPSLTSMSEDGIDEEGSCSESCATAHISELSQFKKDQYFDKGNKTDHLKLMDDFLEMERLACQPTEANGTIVVSDGVVDKMRIENDDGATSLADVPKFGEGKEQHPDLESPMDRSSCNEDHPSRNVPLLKLQSRITSIFQSSSQDSDMLKILEDIRCILQDTHDQLPEPSASCLIEETCSEDRSEQNHSDEVMREITNDELSLKHDSKLAMDQKLKSAISQIYIFVLSLCREAMGMQSSSSDDHELGKKTEELSASVNKVLCNEVGLNDFVLALSNALSELNQLPFNMLSNKHKEGDNNSSECIDKVTLSENKVEDKFSGSCMHTSHSSSVPAIEKAIGLVSESNNTLQKCTLEDFEQLEMEKENMRIDLIKYADLLEQTKLQLNETEQHLVELKSQMDANDKSKSLAETQLKCMTESYKSLESRTNELETEVNLLREKAETLDKELQAERIRHQDDLAIYKELQEQIARNEKSSMCSFVSDVDVDIKAKQDKDIAAATEKLAECQETILLLGRQLNALRPPAEPTGCSSPMSDNTLRDESSSSPLNLQDLNSSQDLDQVNTEMDPLDGYYSQLSPSEAEAGHFPKSPISSKRPNHRLSASSGTLPDKHGRGFSRFFSKGKSDN